MRCLSSGVCLLTLFLVECLFLVVVRCLMVGLLSVDHSVFVVCC